MGLARWFNWIRRRPRLRAHERAVLDSVRSELQGRARWLFEQQLGRYNYVQRHARGKQVCFYRKRYGKVIPCDQFLFPHTSEVLFARVFLESERTGREIIAHVWAVNGRFFSLSFNKPVQKRRSTDLRVKKCQLLADVMQSDATPSGQARQQSSQACPILASLAGTGELTEIAPPPSQKQLEQFQSLWGAYVPADYVQLLSETDGFVYNGWTVLGTSVREVVMVTRTVLVLAENPTPLFLCATMAEPGRNVGLYHHDEEQPAVEWTSFVAALVASGQKGE